MENRINFDAEDPVLEEFYASDDGNEIKIEETNVTTNIASNKQCYAYKVIFYYSWHQFSRNES